MDIPSGIWHSIAGNDAPPVQVGFTRGILAAGIAGIVNTTLLLLPIDDAAKAALMATINPTLIMLSYLLYAFLEPWFKRHVTSTEEEDDAR
ncbi:MAG: hypothetical protein QQN63_00815 [Nitrosopumilus sp.]